MGNKASRKSEEELGSDSDYSDESEEEEKTANGTSQKKAKKQKPKKPGKIAMMKQGYSEMVNAIIRPPRAVYSMDELGPKEFTMKGRKFRRTDLDIQNPRGYSLKCSWWEPHADHRQAAELPCVVYMHGNAGCRLGALEVLEMVLGEGMTLFSFDFAGSGLSDGEFVSLGFYEKEDIATVVNELRGSCKVSTIALWGRSMGAATALLHCHRDPSIAALVLDSPFADLKQLAMELVSRGKQELGYKVPALIVKAVFRLIKGSVKKKAKFDITQLKPITDVDKAFVPALFCAASGDTFVPMHHAQAIHEKYAGDKNIVIVEGDHNSARPAFFLDSAAIFLRTTMQVPQVYALEGYSGSLNRSWRAARRASAEARGVSGYEDMMPDSMRRLADLEEEMIQQAIAASTQDMQVTDAEETLRMDSRSIEQRESDSLPPRVTVTSHDPSSSGGGGGGGGVVEDSNVGGDAADSSIASKDEDVRSAEAPVTPGKPT